MASLANQIDNNPQKNVEIVVHIDEDLGDIQRGQLVDYLTSTDGVSTAEFCPLRYHLILVQYDRDRINSQEVIGRVTDRNIHAQLIGPV
jgi:hypothetical protein